MFRSVRSSSKRNLRPGLPGILLCLILAGLAALPASGGAQTEVAGGGGFTPALDRSTAPSPAFVALVAEGRERLRRENLLPIADPSLATSFQIPLAMNGLGFFSPYGISNFVDQQTGNASVLDWNCGSRTYDEHQGTDFFTWPFGWLLMDQFRVHVIAAASGTLIQKSDGHFDRSCVAGAPDEGNFVVLEHPDGSVSTYLHMKQGSVTTRPLGSAIAAGEYLGVVGSSGSSTGPHLHFAAYSDAIFNAAHLIDPWNGACDSLLAGSQWASPPAYRVPRVNALLTATATPDFPACPTQEVPHEKRLFSSGDPIYFVPFLTDELTSTPKTLEILRPDGSTHSSWNHVTDADYSNSWWFWTWPSFPNEAPQIGRWLFRVTIDGDAYTRAFWVNALFADDFEDARTSSWSATVP